MCTYLDQVGSTYYFRRAVPDDLVGYFVTARGSPRTDWKISLRTKDRESAKRLLPEHVTRTNILIDEARAALREAPENASVAPAEHGEANARAREEAAAVAAVEANKQARYEARAEFRIAARERMMLSTAELTPREAAWRDLVRESGQDLEKLKEAVAGQQAANERLGGRVVPSGARRTVESLIDAYEADKAPGWSASSKKAVIPVFRLLREVFAGRELSGIGREDARAVVALLQELPQHIGKRSALRGLTIKQAVDKGRALGLPVLSPKTINDGYLLHIASMWNWAVKETWLLSTPFTGLAVHDPVDDAERRDPFAPDQLRKLFSAEPWGRPWEPGGERPGAYWVPLLCLFHGLRMGEAAGLRVQDIAEDDGIPVIRVVGYDGRALKTKDARGALPVHPELLRIGFLAFVAERREAGAELLFPDGAANTRGQMGADLGRRFIRHIKALSLTGTKLGMHSFRHNFEDRLRAAELAERTTLALARRAEAGSSRIYGDGLSARQKAEAIAKVSYPGLDLSRLYDPAGVMAEPVLG